MVPEIYRGNGNPLFGCDAISAANLSLADNSALPCYLVAFRNHFYKTNQIEYLLKISGKRNLQKQLSSADYLIFA